MVAVVLAAVFLEIAGALPARASTDQATFVGTVYTNEHFRMVIDGEGAGLLDLGTDGPIGRVGWTVEKLRDDEWRPLTADVSGVVTQSDGDKLHIVQVLQNLSDGSVLTTTFAGRPSDRIDSGPVITGRLTAGADGVYRLRMGVRAAAAPFFELDNRWGSVRVPALGYLEPPAGATEFTAHVNSLVFLTNQLSVRYGMNWDMSAYMYEGVVVSGRGGAINALVDFGPRILAAGQSISPDIVIEGGGGPPPCTPYTVTITFAIFNHVGNIIFNGVSYVSGASASVPAGCGNTYSVLAGNINSGYAFYEWETNAGKFETYPWTKWSTWSADALRPTASGTLTMIVYQPVPAGYNTPWGGYVASVSTSWYLHASGRFKVPSNPPAWLGCSPFYCDDKVGIWVGIGGDPFVVNGGLPLLQAGIMAFTNGSGGPAGLFAWWEFVKNETIDTGIVTLDGSQAIAYGDTIAIDLSVSITSWSSSITVTDVDQASLHWSITYPDIPNIYTAEWIVETPWGCPGGPCHVMPAFGPFLFTSISSLDYPSQMMPLVSVQEGDTFCPGGVAQNQNAGYVTGLNSFTVTLASQAC